MGLVPLRCGWGRGRVPTPRGTDSHKGINGDRERHSRDQRIRRKWASISPTHLGPGEPAEVPGLILHTPRPPPAAPSLGPTPTPSGPFPAARTLSRGPTPHSQSLFQFFVCLFFGFFFFYFWLHWVFFAVCGFSLVAVTGGYSLLQCMGFSLRWLLLLHSTGSRQAGFRSCSMRAQ